ncbi:MAG: 30S ribosomal protein S20 [Verrucomicrobiales bacterium]
MANIKSVEKRARQAEARTNRNKIVKSSIRTEARAFRASVAGEEDSLKPADAFSKLASRLDKAAKRGVIHKNAANRRKSRAARAIAKATKGS